MWCSSSSEVARGTDPAYEIGVAGAQGPRGAAQVPVVVVRPVQHVAAADLRLGEPEGLEVRWTRSQVS
jgi:hypothetical protein